MCSFKSHFPSLQPISWADPITLQPTLVSKTVYFSTDNPIVFVFNTPLSYPRLRSPPVSLYPQLSWNWGWGTCSRERIRGTPLPLLPPPPPPSGSRMFCISRWEEGLGKVAECSLLAGCRWWELLLAPGDLCWWRAGFPGMLSAFMPRLPWWRTVRAAVSFFHCLL